jgi:DDE superfamily endonuclease
VPSVDEKTGIGARGRTRPRKPVAPGRPARQEHEYVRHGTATLLAALDVHRGGVLQAAGVDRNTAANFVAFLDELDACVPTELAVHPVLDNGSSHIANATRWWFHEHRRFHPRDTPPMPPGATRSSCCSGSLPGGCARVGSSPQSPNWSTGSWRSSPRTTAPPNRFAGPTTAVPYRPPEQAAELVWRHRACPRITGRRACPASRVGGRRSGRSSRRP